MTALRPEENTSVTLVVDLQVENLKLHLVKMPVLKTDLVYMKEL